MNSLLGFGSSQSRFSQVLLFTAFLFHQALLALTNPEPDCNNLFRCGNLTVGFPFWGENRPETCGHSHLRLRCDENRTTSLLIEESRYILLQYDNTTRTLTLARFGYYFQDSLCVPPFSNTTLDSDILEYLPGYKNLTVYYACNVSSPNDPYSFNCKGGGIGLISTGSEDYRNCAKNLNFTVPQDFDVDSPVDILLRFKKVLKDGFKVKLKFDDEACRKCVSSGRFCGSEYHKQICYCNNGIENSTNCPSSSPPVHQATESASGQIPPNPNIYSVFSFQIILQLSAFWDVIFRLVCVER